MSRERLQQLCGMVERIREAQAQGGEHAENVQAVLAGFMSAAAILLPSGKWQILMSYAELKHSDLKDLAGKINQWCPAPPEPDTETPPVTVEA